MDWTLALRTVPSERCVVSHQPETPRYARARQKLRHLVHGSILVGYQQDAERERTWHIAVWAAPLSRRDPGYFACFRLLLNKTGAPDRAVLYCFYDGADRSPSFRTPEAARAYALAQGFREP